MKESHSTYASIGVGGSIAVVLQWLWGLCNKTEMPADVSIALASLISVGVGFFLHRVNGAET